MKRAFIIACGIAIVLTGCKGKSGVRSQSSGGGLFDAYQRDIDRARQVQQQARQRADSIDSIASKAAKGLDQ